MSEVQVGEDRILNRPTFLFQGIFVNQGTQVRVMEATAEGLSVQFLDKEGFPHVLNGVRAEELI